MDAGGELTGEQAQQSADVDNIRVGEVPGHFQEPRLWLTPSASSSCYRRFSMPP
jgi:hypothetical protein